MCVSPVLLHVGRIEPVHHGICSSINCSRGFLVGRTGIEWEQATSGKGGQNAVRRLQEAIWKKACSLSFLWSGRLRTQRRISEEGVSNCRGVLAGVTSRRENYHPPRRSHCCDRYSRVHDRSILLIIESFGIAPLIEVDRNPMKLGGVVLRLSTSGPGSFSPVEPSHSEPCRSATKPCFSRVSVQFQSIP
jgi:hypothetical protein